MANTSANLDLDSATPLRTPLPFSESSLPAAWMLAKREWIRFFRQPFRVIAALGQPILFWILFGTGFHRAFQGTGPQESYMGFFIPGTAALILLFTAIFSTISIIEDRREGFLQGVLVSPARRWGIAFGKSLGGAAIAWAQAIFFLLLAIGIGMVPLGPNLLILPVFLFVAALALTAMGVCFAWPMESTQGYHAAMNMVMLPMWLLSGAFFPIPAQSDGMPLGQRILQLMMQCNPMSYIVAGIRHLCTPKNTLGIENAEVRIDWIPTMQASWLVTLGFALAMGALATVLVHRRQKGELQ